MNLSSNTLKANKPKHMIDYMNLHQWVHWLASNLITTNNVSRCCLIIKFDLTSEEFGEADVFQNLNIRQSLS